MCTVVCAAADADENKHFLQHDVQFCILIVEVGTSTSVGTRIREQVQDDVWTVVCEN